MTEENKPQFSSTRVIVWGKEYNAKDKIYSGVVETKFYKEQPFTLKIFDKPEKKEGEGRAGTVIGEISIANETKFIRENNGSRGKSYGATIIKDEFKMNLKPMLSRSDVLTYELNFREREDLPEAAAEEENKDLPF